MHIVVAMSGGVDSSVAAALLQAEGHRVTGVFMRNGIAAGPAAKRARQGCCGVDDAADAARVAQLLDVPFYALDHEAEFDRLIDGFAAEYASGRTPNPCIVCNRDLKFGRLLAFADALGADAVATGHYARLEAVGGRVALARARDETKDQTYVLFPLSQEQLARARFPLGDLTKEDVRALAEEFRLPVAEKPESMEICFVPDSDYRAVVGARRPEAVAPGPIVDDVTGAVVGRHGGIGTVTVGQRRGLTAEGGGLATGVPRYVTSIDPESNTVRVGAAADLGRTEVTVSAWNGVAAETPRPGATLRGRASVRSTHAPAAACATGVDAPDRRVRVTFERPVLAPAPGQALVLYDHGGRVLGGGWIAS